jgi:hypothetical protein
MLVILYLVSIELQDTYLRLDQNIDQFLNYLDKKVVERIIFSFNS